MTEKQKIQFQIVQIIHHGNKIGNFHTGTLWLSNPAHRKDASILSMFREMHSSPTHPPYPPTSTPLSLSTSCHTYIHTPLLQSTLKYYTNKHIHILHCAYYLQRSSLTWCFSSRGRRRRAGSIVCCSVRCWHCVVDIAGSGGCVVRTTC